MSQQHILGYPHVQNVSQQHILGVNTYVECV